MVTSTKGLVLWGAILLIAVPAGADFTATGGSGETNTLTIMNTLYGMYGGNFSGAAFGDTVYTNGTVTALRVDDYGAPGGTLNILDGHGHDGVNPGTSSALDQVWDDGIATMQAEARFAGYSQSFGYTDVSGYHELFEYTGPWGFIAPNAYTGTIDLTGTTWSWDRSDANGDASTPGGHHWSSDESANRDGLDHMITYEITGIPDLASNERVWLLLWDDQTDGGDRDFNDLAVEVRATPVPGAALLGAVGLGLVGFRRRKGPPPT